MVLQNMLEMIFSKLAFLIDLLTKTTCLYSSLVLPFHLEVLWILHQLSGNWLLKILVCGTMTEMVLLIQLLAQAEVPMFWLVLIVVAMGEAFMQIGRKVVGQVKQLLSGLKLEKQWVIFLGQQNYLVYETF
jgi:hypothetical protein